MAKPFEPGEKLFLVHTGEEVTVLRVENNKSLVYVELDGDEIPVDLEFLTYKPPAPKEKQQVAPPVMPARPTAPALAKPDLETGVSLAFEPVPDHGEIHSFRVLLVNGFKEALEVKMQFLLHQTERFSVKESVSPQSALLLGHLLFDELNEMPSASIRLFGKYQNLLFDQQLKIKGGRLFKQHYLEPLLGVMVYGLRLLDTYPQPKAVPAVETVLPRRNWTVDPEQLRHMMLSSAVVKDEPLVAVSEEIDLHLSALRKDHTHFPKEEMLHYQLQECEKAIDRAMAAGLSHYFIIHGKGKGRLREAVHALLRQHPGVKEFHHRYHPRYEFGATEVIFIRHSG